VLRLTRDKPTCAAIALGGLLSLGAAGAASAATSSGGAAFIPPPPPPKKATILNGKAIAPAGAPRRVKRVITAGNRIIGKPYRYGGGHRAFSSRLDSGYDCSGSISYALYGGRFLRSPLDSRSFARWGRSGPGRWITVYTNPGHAYAVIAGLRLDTSTGGLTSRRIARTSERGPRWRLALRRTRGFNARHPLGL
jgi:hypothetical protein